ncbi:hypothetical protein TcCL_NonESM12763, partial [Trypanosoma cruzi]
CRPDKLVAQRYRPVSVIKLRPQKGVLRGTRFAFLPIVARRPSALRSTWASHNATSPIDPCNAYIVDPSVDTHQWRCSPEAVRHRRHHRNCRSNNNLENFRAGLVSHWMPCQLHQRAVLHAASKETPSLPR